MTALAVTRPTAPGIPDGLVRSARLMRALGPEAAPVWNELSREEASALSDAMDHLDDDYGDASDAVESFVIAHKRFATHSAPSSTVWTGLSGLETGDLVQLASGQHPQTLALILSRMTGDAAGRLLRSLETTLAVDVMQRLLHIGAANPHALASLERCLTDWLGQADRAMHTGGHERIARIFDQMDSRSEKSLLAALETAEPGASERVRALMFTFDDLANLDAGGLQTLLSASDRTVLTVALKGARPETSAAFFRNMTQRAGDLLREEISLLGPVRRSDVDAARLDLVSLARTLINRGDIRAGAPEDEDELVE